MWSLTVGILANKTWTYYEPIHSLKPVKLDTQYQDNDPLAFLIGIASGGGTYVIVFKWQEEEEE